MVGYEWGAVSYIFYFYLSRVVFMEIFIRILVLVQSIFVYIVWFVHKIFCKRATGCFQESKTVCLCDAYHPVFVRKGGVASRSIAELSDATLG